MASSACLVLTGPDRYRKRLRTEALLADGSTHPLDRSTFDALEDAAAIVLAAAREHPVASARRLVVVDHAERLGAEAGAWLAEHLDDLAQTTCLILQTDGELEGKHPLAALGRRATVERFPWLTPEELGRWIQDRLAGAGKKIAPAGVQELAQVIGADLAALERVLEQLTSWLGARAQISQADCREFLAGRRPAPSADRAAGRERGPFAVVEAIGRRQIAAALSAAAEQLDAGRDVLEVFGMIVWQLQRWLQVARLTDAGMPRPRIEALTGIKAWQVERVQAELAGRSLEWLGRRLDACRHLDLEIKTGRIAPRVGLELLIVQLCQG